MNLPTDNTLEQRFICLCHSNQRTHPKIGSEHFYNKKLSKIYAALKNGATLLDELDFKREEVCADSFYDCLATDAFSPSELSESSKKMLDLHERRRIITSCHKQIAEAQDMSNKVVVSEESQEGFNDLMSEHEDIASGVFKLLPSPWYMLNQDSRFTEGKAICIICGDPGVGKSFFTTQLFLNFVLEGTKAILWGAEDNPRFHTRRAIAQYMGNGNLCDYEFLKANHASVSKIYSENKDVIDLIMESLYTSDDLSKENLIKWCWEKARAGYEVIGIDPITFFSGNGKAHEADQKIMEQLNTIRKTLGTRFIIVTHPRESSGMAVNQDGIAGGRAVSRFAQIILWITNKEEGDVNRCVYNLKTRNGKREFGGRVDMNFSRETARFEEIGGH